MTFIYPRLAIGNFEDARQLVKLRQKGINSILNCAKGWAGVEDGNMIYHKVGLVDGPGNDPNVFNAAVILLLGILSDEQNYVLVHCQAGISRSATVVATYLAWVNKSSFEEAVRMIQVVRPQVLPNESLVKLAKEFLAARDVNQRI